MFCFILLALDAPDPLLLDSHYLQYGVNDGAPLPVDTLANAEYATLSCIEEWDGWDDFELSNDDIALLHYPPATHCRRYKRVSINGDVYRSASLDASR